MRTTVVFLVLLSISVDVASAAPESSSSKYPSSTIAAGKKPSSIAVGPSGKYAYVANAESTSISVFSIDTVTGRLSAQSIVKLKGYWDAEFVTVDPTGKFLYVATWGDFPRVAVFDVNQDTGSLIAVKDVEIIGAPYSIAVHPSGKFAYVAQDFGISVFSVDPVTGELTLKGNVKKTKTVSISNSADPRRKFIATEPGPRYISVDPSGEFVFMANANSMDVSVFAIDPATGLLKEKSIVAAGPNHIAVHPSGKFVYAGNFIFAFNRATGELTSSEEASVGDNIAVHPTGKFVYADNNYDSVSMLAVNPDTGVLTTLGKVGAEDQPSSIAVHPNGKFVYVTNRKSNNVSMYIVNPDTGALTAIDESKE